MKGSGLAANGIDVPSKDWAELKPEPEDVDTVEVSTRPGILTLKQVKSNGAVVQVTQEWPDEVWFATSDGLVYSGTKSSTSAKRREAHRGSDTAEYAVQPNTWNEGSFTMAVNPDSVLMAGGIHLTNGNWKDLNPSLEEYPPALELQLPIKRNNDGGEEPMPVTTLKFSLNPPTREDRSPWDFHWPDELT